MTLLTAWLLFSAFMVGRWSVYRGTTYRMGEKVLRNTQDVLDRRVYVGDNAMQITSVTRWSAQGHDWELSVKQLSKKEVN